MNKFYITQFLRLSRAEQLLAVEAIIFSSEEPVSVQNLFNVLIKSDLFSFESENNDLKEQTTDLNISDIKLNNQKRLKEFNLDDYPVKEAPEATPQFFEKIIEEINNELFSTGRPYRIIKIAGGWQFAIREEYGKLIQQLTKSKNKRRLSQAALEVLAITAYRQPITKPEIEQIRGVNSADIINSLVEKNLVEITGRKDSLGKPLIYGTTNEFLKTFGLYSLDDLPKLREFSEIPQNENSETIMDLSSELLPLLQENFNESNNE
jgi:segregation and condensation protein B